MIRLSDIDPTIPRAGWPGRRVAIARLVLEVVAGAAFLIALLTIAFVYIWLGAPAGATP